MKKIKKYRNMSLIAGFLLLINIIIQLVTKTYILVIILNVIACFCFFMDAFSKHKKTMENKES